MLILIPTVTLLILLTLLTLINALNPANPSCTSKMTKLNLNSKNKTILTMPYLRKHCIWTITGYQPVLGLIDSGHLVFSAYTSGSWR